MIHTCHLPDRALFHLGGRDSVDFLHNLITCDVIDLGPGDVTFGALLTPQGKVMFDFHIIKRGGGFLFDVAADQRAPLMKRFGFYKLRAAVDLEPMGDLRVFAQWGVSGSYSKQTGDGRHRKMGRRVYAGTHETNAYGTDYMRHRLSVGIPQSGLDFELGDVFPHDVLMDQFDGGGVDFGKGCYVGQEVVSRMKHRNSARNRFVKVSGNALPPVGTALTVEDRTVGTMGCSINNSGLALVRIDKVGKAMARDQQVMVGDKSVDLHLPEFVEFQWPAE